MDTSDSSNGEPPSIYYKEDQNGHSLCLRE